MGRSRQRWWWHNPTQHNTTDNACLLKKDGNTPEYIHIGDVCLLCGRSFRPPGWRFDVTAYLTAADENDVPSRILGMLSQLWSSARAIFPTLSLTVPLPQPHKMPRRNIIEEFNYKPPLSVWCLGSFCSSSSWVFQARNNHLCGACTCCVCGWEDSLPSLEMVT